MPALIGKKFSVFNANTFASSFVSDSIYLYLGKVLVWPDDEDNPPAPEDTPKYHNEIWDKMAGLVRVTKNQVSLGISRVNWTSGSKYGQYHHANTSLGDYYILAGVNDRDVYKCLDNNGESPSTSKPTHKNLGISREPDGYAWKYMYTIPDTQFKKFATDTVIPVMQDRDVAEASRSNRVIHLPISANNTLGVGGFYRGLGFVNSSYSTASSNATVFTTVSANASTNEIKVIADNGLAIQANYYNNSAFYITSGVAAGTYRKILTSKAGAKSTGVDAGYVDDKASNLVLSSVVSNIANGDTFIIGPMITLQEAGGGSGFLAIGNTNRYGNVTSIDVSLTGLGYSNGSSNATINGDYHPTSNGLVDGSGADVEFTIPPAGGHGSNIASELEAKYVIVAPETPVVKDHETGKFVGYGNDFRQVGLVRNPISARSGFIAYESMYDLKTTLYFQSPTYLKFKKDQRVYNTLAEGSERASGIVYNVCGDSPHQYLSLVDVRGQFANGDIIYNRLGDSASISGVSLANHQYPSSSQNPPISSVVNSDVAKYTGEIIYHENISPITRRLDQKEQFKFIFEF